MTDEDRAYCTIPAETRERLVARYGLDIVERFERGAYAFEPPPVTTVGWTIDAWFAYIFGPR